MQQLNQSSVIEKKFVVVEATKVRMHYYNYIAQRLQFRAPLKYLNIDWIVEDCVFIYTLFYMAKFL